MTTLTRTRTTVHVGPYEQTRLVVIGPAGAVSFVTYDGPVFAAHESVRVHSLSSDDTEPDVCDMLGALAWCDSSSPKQALAAWRSGGDVAAYAVLEDLYRSEFGGAA